MKNINGSLRLTAVVLSSLAGHASAAAIIGNAYEGFNGYTSGATVTGLNLGTGFNLNGSSGANTAAWRNGAASPNNPTISATTLSFSSTGYAAGTGDKMVVNASTATSQVFRGLGQVVDSGTMYFSYLTQKTTASNRSLNVAFFDTQTATSVEKFSFGQAGSATGTGNNSNGNFALALDNGATLLTGGTAYGTGTHLVIGRIDFNFSAALDRLTFYLDPGDVTSEAALTPYIQTTAANSINITSFGSFRPFAGFSAATPAPVNPSVSGAFDEFRFGATFASVVPEPSSALLLVSGLSCMLIRRWRGC